MTLDQQLFEIMCRAPSAPTWYVPDMTKYGFPAGARTFEVPGGNKEHNQFCEDFKRETLAQWPSAYARMVMEAAKPKNTKPVNIDAVT